MSFCIRICVFLVCCSFSRLFIYLFIYLIDTSCIQLVGYTVNKDTIRMEFKALVYRILTTACWNNTPIL